MSHQTLTDNILELSQSPDWPVAKLEWELAEIYFYEQPGYCACGHFPIIEACLLKNRFNKNQVVVGNCCVKKFIGLPSDLIFQAIKRIKVKIDNNLNKEAVEFAHQKGWINDWERNFYLDRFKKRIFSQKQYDKYVSINEKVLEKMKKQ